MKLRLISFSVIALLMVAGCNDDDPETMAPTTGMITGRLHLTDEFGIDLTDHSNLMITVQTGESAFSDDTGSYRVSGLKKGIYTLTYEKSGFGTFKKFNIEVNTGSNGTVLNGIDYIGQKSTTEISNLTAVFNPNDSTYTFGCVVNPVPDASHPRAFRLFFRKTNNVDFENYLFTPVNTWVATVGTGNITGFSRQLLYGGGFITGDSVYVVAYGESIRTNTYTDPSTNKKVYPNINTNSPSNIVGFVLQ